jgi:hypothetical protein
MNYYPKFQIKTDLYTNGNEEYVLSTTQQPYIGYYYKTSTGQLYTGKNPQDGPNILLLPLLTLPHQLIENTQGNVIEPFNILSPDVDNPILIDPLNKKILNGLSNRFLPLFNQPSPSLQDYILGSFSRYFCKKTNELKYIEIDKETHDKLKIKDSQIAWDLYEPQLIVWQISGDEEGTFLANKSNIALLEKHQKWYGFSQYLKEDYLKYHQSQNINNL